MTPTAPTEPTTTGFDHRLKFKLVELIGLTTAAAGLAFVISDCWTLGQRPALDSIALAGCGLSLIAFGIDLLVRPAVRRAPDTTRITETVLRLIPGTNRTGPKQSHSSADDGTAARGGDI